MMADDDRERLAAEYALGTLDPVERARVTVRMVSDADLRRLVDDWHARLGPLAHAVAPVAPPPELWARIEQKLPVRPDTAATAVAGVAAAAAAAARAAPAAVPREPARDPAREGGREAPRESAGRETARDAAREPGEAPGYTAWRRAGGLVRLWAVGATGLATLLAILLIVILVLPPERPAPGSPGSRFVAVLADEAREPGFLITVDLAGDRFAVRPIGATRPMGRSLQLWLISGGGTQIQSLGLLEPDRMVIDAVARRLGSLRPPADAQLSVTLEPEGGSPTGVGTGPVLFSGRLLEAPL